MEKKTVCCILSSICKLLKSCCADIIYLYLLWVRVYRKPVLELVMKALYNLRDHCRSWRALIIHILFWPYRIALENTDDCANTRCYLVGGYHRVSAIVFTWVIYHITTGEYNMLRTVFQDMVYDAPVRFREKNAELTHFGCCLPCVSPPLTFYKMVSQYRLQDTWVIIGKIHISTAIIPRVYKMNQLIYKCAFRMNKN